MIMRSPRRLRLVAVSGVVLLATAACSSGSSGGGSAGNGSSTSSAGTPVRGGTLNMLGSGDIDYMDPNISYYSIGYLALRLWSRQLFTYPAQPGDTTTAVPDLATEMPTVSNGGISKDGKTYTITIRQGAKWNTTPARQVTAADEVRGVKRTCNPVQPFGGIPDFAALIKGYQSFCNGMQSKKTAPEIANYIEHTNLPGVVATNSHTVVFHLTHPATYFLGVLTLPAFSPAPKEFLNYLPGSSQLAQHTLSDGPYEIQSYNPTKQIVFVRNPAWSAKSDPIRKAYVDKIVVSETGQQQSIQQQLETGSPSADMEWDSFPAPSQLPALIQKKDPNLNLGVTASTNPYILYNMVSPNNSGAMKKAAVRHAISYALDRSSMLQVLGGTKINPPLTHVLPPNILGSKNFDLYPHNAAKAKQLLKQAGVSHLTLKVLYRPSSQGSSKVFQTLQQDLSQVGIHVTGVTSPNADFYTKYLEVPSVAHRGVWDMAIAGWEADWYGNAALSFFNPLFSGKPSFPPVGSNFGFYDSAAANKLIQQATVAKTTKQAEGLWAKADMQVMKDDPFFPLTSPKQANYHASQVHNAIYVPAIQNFDPTNVWLAQGKQGG
ncbi:MAG TPA: ABC transporter substrate-binding protein [Segeticoccus sp.]|uniref:ABC transporter substrate-binding protein n=1 Tax=Segeticoccus sp. TaxID=2706531 RepID=UPI002D7F090C|nr:ABC transporter substrate-binding protein [Segeticoccus sp.]HET8600787.1 ABC transporter substrate-binding protein [Segeticoccus sp.]